MDENITALEMEYSRGIDLNATFEICEYIEEPPIILVLDQNKTTAINWLLSKRVNLNLKGNPAIVTAVERCSIKTIALLIQNGAKINAKDHVGKTAMNAALYHNRLDLIPFLVEHGYKITEDGSSLRQAASNRQYHAIDVLLALGARANFHQRNMVYPYNTSPVGVAAEINDFKLVQLLVQHGADVTVKNAYGERPFNYAVNHQNKEMMQYIQALEPAQWHQEEQKLIELSSYKLPLGLISLLRSESRAFNSTEAKGSLSHITFNSLLNVKEVNWHKHIFLDLLSNVDQYDATGFLVWYPKKKCLAHADYEHDEFRLLGSWQAFIDNPFEFINQIFA